MEPTMAFVLKTNFSPFTTSNTETSIITSNVGLKIVDFYFIVSSKESEIYLK